MTDVKLIPDLAVSQPGSEADHLIAFALATAEQLRWHRPRVLDMGCGSGYVAIRMALEGADAEGCDIDPRAVATACRNAQLNGLEIPFCESDLCRGLASRRPYQMILFNPPVETGVHSPLRNTLKNLVRRCRPLVRALKRLRVDTLFTSGGQTDLTLRLLNEAPTILTADGVVIVLQPSPALTAKDIPRFYGILRFDSRAVVLQRMSELPSPHMA